MIRIILKVRSILLARSAKKERKALALHVKEERRKIRRLERHSRFLGLLAAVVGRKKDRTADGCLVQATLSL